MTVEPWPLPASWHWSSFKEVARVASDLVDPMDFGNAAHIAPNHIERETGRLLPFATVAEDGVMSAKHRFHAGQILYSKIRPYLAKVVVVDFEGLCSADMYPIETGLEPRFLKWWMLTSEFTRQAAGQQARTVLPKINKHALGMLPVPCPPRDEQRRIVDILEDHLSRLEAASELLASAGRRASAWSRSFIDASLWEDRTPKVAVYDLLAEPMRNGHSARAVRDSACGIRTLTLTAVTRNEFSDRFTKVTSADPDRVATLWLRPGDVLVQRSNTPELVGTTARYEGPDDWAIFPDLLIRLRANEQLVLSAYLCLALRSERAHRQMRLKAKGLAGSMPKIDQATIGSTVLPIPSLEAQRALIGRMDEVELIRARTMRAEEAGRSKGGLLRQALLAAAFSGRLTGTGTDIEMVEEMAGV